MFQKSTKGSKKETARVHEWEDASLQQREEEEKLQRENCRLNKMLWSKFPKDDMDQEKFEKRRIAKIF